MELVWYGAGSFRLIERGYPGVLTDPFTDDNPEIKLPHIQSEIVTSSRILEEPRLAKWSGVSGVIHTVAGPGEYEIGGVFITGVSTYRQKDETLDNVIYTINMDGVVVCHFGECGLVPTQAQLETLGRINILVLPVGIPGGLTTIMASEVVSMIVPDIVVPMHYAVPDRISTSESVDPFLKVMGVGTPTILPSLKVEPSSNQGVTQVVLLEPAI